MKKHNLVTAITIDDSKDTASAVTILGAILIVATSTRHYGTYGLQPPMKSCLLMRGEYCETLVQPPFKLDRTGQGFCPPSFATQSNHDPS